MKKLTYLGVLLAALLFVSLADAAPKWEQVGKDSDWRSLSVTSEGVAYGIKKNQTIWKWSAGKGWEKLPGKAVQVSATHLAVWVVNSAGKLYRWEKDKNSWKRITGPRKRNRSEIRCKQVAAINNWRIKVVTWAGELWEHFKAGRSGGLWRKAKNPGVTKKLSASSGRTLVLGKNNKVRELKLKSRGWRRRYYWKTLSDKLFVDFSIDVGGQVIMAVDGDGVVFENWKPLELDADSPKPKLKKISVGKKRIVWGIADNGAAWRLVP